MNNQYSYQTNYISDFTLSFIKAIKDHSSNEIRYKDIIDVISDEFSSNKEQTPFFVIQADLTERFCTITPSLKEYLNEFQKEPESKTVSKVEEKKATLVDKIIEESKEYVNKEGAQTALLYLKSNLEKFKFDSDIDQLFESKVEFHENYHKLYKLGPIIRWILEHNIDYFNSLVDVEKFDSNGFQTIEKELELKLDVPFKAITIDFINKFPNIQSYNCQIVFALSRKELRLFYSLTNYIEENWDTKTIEESNIKWTTIRSKIALNESILKSVNSIKKQLGKKIESDLQSRFENKSSSEPNKTEGSKK